MWVHYRNNANAEEVKISHSAELFEEILGNKIPDGIFRWFDLIAGKYAHFVFVLDGTFRDVVAHE